MTKIGSVTSDSDQLSGPVDPALLQALEWRPVGPFRGGRVVAVAGDPVHKQTFYFGSTGGGVWKTEDGGVFWRNVSDGFFKRASVGALAVAPSDSNVIYAGMGETTIRGNVSHGDGVYRSTDAGASWTHLGLEATRNIAKVRVDPRDPDRVYVAAFGHAHGPNAERGVYRSTDGGANWQLVLFRSDVAGAIDLTLDPHNPRILYAAFWEASRGPYALTSGGPGSSLYKSTDGGDSWTEITRNPGLPKGLLGKIGIAVSPARSGRIWAIVEAEDGAVFRSDDRGATWKRLSEDRNLRQRAWYYHHIYADPQDSETVWVLNVECWKSTDGGQTFTTLPVPHGDNHDLWFDPADPLRLIEGNDGGACVSFNGGATWSSIYNQPTAEFYHVTTDNQVPYRLYGAQQDNTTISVPSRSPIAAITREYAYEIGGGESGYIAVDPRDHHIVYAGSYQGALTRYDHRTGQRRNIMVWPESSMGAGAAELRYRFQWTAPILLSPHDPGVLYITSNVVHRSRDEGASWEEISPDLTRNDPATLGPSGGPLTKDNTGAEYYATIFAFAESPLQAGLLWAGSDDGLVHVSKDGGTRWENVTPPDLPPWALISIIEPSPHAAGVAYVAATRYKHDDFNPYLYKTNDFGATWTRVTTGIPADDFTRVIREDPARRGLLYAGTETAVYVSFNDGANWQSLQLNLPVVPIHDLVVKDGDLIAATHGRAFWILDDLTPLYQLNDTISEAPAHLFPPRTVVRYRTNWGFGRQTKPGRAYQMTGATIVPLEYQEEPGGEKKEHFLDAGTNPPDGVVVRYYLKERPAGEVRLSFLDATGAEIKTFTSAPEEGTPADQANEAGAGLANSGPGKDASDEENAEAKEPRVRKEAGLNRFIWNMRYPDASKVPGDKSMEMMAAGTAGPLAPPGKYQVRLSAGDESIAAPFEVVKDPRVVASQADFDAQFAFLSGVRDKLTATHDAIARLRAIRAQTQAWAKRFAGDERREQRDAADRLRTALDAIEAELIQTQAKSRQDTLNFPVKLNAKLAGLAAASGGADFAPTRQALAVFDALAARIDAQLAVLDDLLSKDVPEFNAMLKEAEVPALDPRPRNAPAAGK